MGAPLSCVSWLVRGWVCPACCTVSNSMGSWAGDTGPGPALAWTFCPTDQEGAWTTHLRDFQSQVSGMTPGQGDPETVDWMGKRHVTPVSAHGPGHHPALDLSGLRRPPTSARLRISWTKLFASLCLFQKPSCKILRAWKAGVGRQGWAALGGGFGSRGVELAEGLPQGQPQTTSSESRKARQALDNSGLSSQGSAQGLGWLVGQVWDRWVPWGCPPWRDPHVDRYAHNSARPT